MKIGVRTLMAIYIGALVVLGVAGCEKKGPAENAGEKIDEAVKDAERKIEDATD